MRHKISSVVRVGYISTNFIANNSMKSWIEFFAYCRYRFKSDGYHDRFKALHGIDRENLCNEYVLVYLKSLPHPIQDDVFTILSKCDKWLQVALLASLDIDVAVLEELLSNSTK